MDQSKNRFKKNMGAVIVTCIPIVTFIVIELVCNIFTGRHLIETSLDVTNFLRQVSINILAGYALLLNMGNGRMDISLGGQKLVACCGCGHDYAEMDFHRIWCAGCRDHFPHPDHGDYPVPAALRGIYAAGVERKRKEMFGNMNKNREVIQKIISKMSLEEKAGLCVGKDFWHIRNIEEMGIPPMILTDGPHGIRKQAGAADQLTLGISETAVCFPAGCAIASSFDPAVSELVGEELGKLAKTMDIGVVLGPAINMKRSPLCGRNFEYYSEDPLVAGIMGAGAVRGLQKQDVSACPKHFAANNQELYRQTSNARVDEQTLRKIYLAAFEKVVKDAGSWSMMCSYNRVNGTYSCENPLLLTGILRDEWGVTARLLQTGAPVTIRWKACVPSWICVCRAREKIW